MRVNIVRQCDNQRTNIIKRYQSRGQYIDSNNSKNIKYNQLLKGIMSWTYLSSDKLYVHCDKPQNQSMDRHWTSICNTTKRTFIRDAYNWQSNWIVIFQTFIVTLDLNLDLRNKHRLDTGRRFKSYVYMTKTTIRVTSIKIEALDLRLQNTALLMFIYR